MVCWIRKSKTFKIEDRYILKAVKKDCQNTFHKIQLNLNLTNISKWKISY